MSVATVHKVISQYNRLGAATIETPGKGGRRKCYLNLAQEREFLTGFFAKASKGRVPTIAEIKSSDERLVGHTVDKTTIYRLLDRHKWRQIVPRPSHIKADPEAQAEFKKTSHSW